MAIGFAPASATGAAHTLLLAAALLGSSRIGAALAGTIEEFTVYTDPVNVRPGYVHNFPTKPVALPEWVVAKYKGKQMGVVKFQLDIVKRGTGLEDVRVPLYEVYNHHTIQAMGTNKFMNALWTSWSSGADPLGPHPKLMQSTRPHCGGANLTADASRGGFTGQMPRFWWGPIGGAEYRDADRDLPSPYRQIVDSPESLLAIQHFVNVNVSKDTGTKSFECPCTSDRVFNIRNGTIDGVKPLPFQCSLKLLLERNAACKLNWYKGGYRCCENGAPVVEKPFRGESPDTVYGKFTLRVEEVTQNTRPAIFAQLDVTGNNAEYDVPKCRFGIRCIHTIEHSQVMRTVDMSHNSLEWELVTARGHQHVAGLGMELYDDHGKLLCASTNHYGRSAAAGDELGFLAGIPPCVFGPAPLPPPPKFRLNTRFRIVSHYNSTEEHLGVMGFWFMQIAPVEKAKAVSDPDIVV